jgi:isochorismate synthase
VTAPETAAPPRAVDPIGGAVLRAERRPLPALDPLALLAALPGARSHLFWRAPGEQALVAIGRALRVAPAEAGSGRDGILALGPAVEEELGAALGPGEAPPDDLRVLFGVAFDPSAAFGRRAGGVSEADSDPWRGFAPVEAFVPEVLARLGGEGGGAGGEALLVGEPGRLAELRVELAALVEAASRRPAPEEPLGADLAIEWAGGAHRSNVAAALQALRRPGLSKVVLAHAVEVRRGRPFAPAALLAELGRRHPGCFLFSLRPSPGAAVFLGASPERLARVEEGAGGVRRVLSGALAGSAPRGATPAEDEALGRRLLASVKDLDEHAIVGDMIAEALAPLCLRLERGGAPVLERLRNVQHLFTPVSGVLRPGRGIFDAVAALHPTPAVGGMPRERALAAIRELEREPRGLYAGVVGWADLAGRGDSAVAIRSALVDGDRARAFAGGGIVATSDPDVEVEETRLKMAAVLEALEARADRHERPSTG